MAGMTERFDKLTVLRDQINSAIVLVSLEDGFVATHTIIMAAEEIFRTLYVKKNLLVEFDYRMFIKDEYQSEYLAKMREKYNFFKHADRDIDAFLDVDRNQIHDLNEVLLALLVHGYMKVFGPGTTSMETYARWFAVSHPQFFKWNNISGGTELEAKIKKLGADPAIQRQVLRVMLYGAGVLPKDDFDLLQFAPS